jgi:hypothetical protein
MIKKFPSYCGTEKDSENTKRNILNKNKEIILKTPLNWQEF